MYRALLGFATLATTVAFTPAQGQTVELSSFSGSSGLRNSGFVQPPPPGYPPGFNQGRGRHIHVADVLAGYSSGYAGGYYDGGDYDANRSFSPDSWNDWWHERPDRAFPRWVRHNQNCERMWYSGAGWRC